MKDPICTRRIFLQRFGVVTLGTFSIAYLSSCSDSNPTEADNNQDPASLVIDLSLPENQSLTNIGGTIALNANPVDGQGLLLIRVSDTEVRALSRRCTHQGCTIGAFQGGISECPCHGSRYNTSGNVVQGPAESSLRRYDTVLENNIVTISTQ